MANENKSSVNEAQNLGATVEDRKTGQGFTPGPWRSETIEDWHEVIVYSPWSETVKPSESATFGDSRGAWISKLEYNNGVPSRTQAEANARLIAAAPAMFDLLKATQAYIETQENETMPDEMAALWNRISEVVTPISDRGTDGPASETRSE